MSNRSVTYTLNLNSNVLAALQQHEAMALRVDSAFQQINSTLHAVGISLALREMIELGKEWVQGAAEMETAIIRIKNVSANASQGLMNNIFIRDEVTKFKLDIFKATEAYGDFLTMVRGSGLASSEIRKLHDEVLTIGKVTGISDGQMDASVRNLGKLLEEGTLEGRHLRPLTYQMSGLMPYISRELGLTNQELEKALASGQLTKAAIDSKVLLSAIEKYSIDLAGKLPEALNSIQSSLNETRNEWTDFKNDLVFSMKPELQGFLLDIKDSVHWLREHQDAIKRVGTALGDALKIYIGWRAMMFTVNTLNGVFVTTSSARVTSIIAQSTATAGLNSQIALLNINLEALIALQTAAAVSAGTMLTAQEAVNLAMYQQLGLNAMMPGMAMNNALAMNGAAIASIRSSIAGALTGTVLTVGLAWIGLEALEGLNNLFGGNKNSGDEGYKFHWTDMFTDAGWDGSESFTKAKRAGASQANHDFLQKLISEKYLNKGTQFPVGGENLFGLIQLQQKVIDMGQNPYHFDLIKSLVGYDKTGKLNPHKNEDLWDKLKSLGYNLGEHMWANPNEDGEGHGGTAAAAAADAAEKLKAGGVRGNSSYNVTINIPEMIGMQNPTFTIKNMQDMEDIKKTIGVEVTKILTEVVNDAQLIGPRR